VPRRLSWPLIIFILLLPLTAQAPPPVSATAEVNLTIESYSFICGLDPICVVGSQHHTGTGSDVFSCGANYGATLSASVIWHPCTKGESTWSASVSPEFISGEQINDAVVTVTATGPGIKNNKIYYPVIVAVTMTPGP